MDGITLSRERGIDMLEIAEQNANMVAKPSRVELESPECIAGCVPCYLDCAMCRFVIVARDREIELLRRERPPLAHPRWPDWHQALQEAEAHRTELLKRLRQIAPSDPQVEPAATVRPIAAQAFLH